VCECVCTRDCVIVCARVFVCLCMYTFVCLSKIQPLAIGNLCGVYGEYPSCACILMSILCRSKTEKQELQNWWLAKKGNHAAELKFEVPFE